MSVKSLEKLILDVLLVVDHDSDLKNRCSTGRFRVIAIHILSLTGGSSVFLSSCAPAAQVLVEREGAFFRACGVCLYTAASALCRGLSLPSKRNRFGECNCKRNRSGEISSRFSERTCHLITGAPATLKTLLQPIKPAPIGHLTPRLVHSTQSSRRSDPQLPEPSPKSSSRAVGRITQQITLVITPIELLP